MFPLDLILLIILIIVASFVYICVFRKLGPRIVALKQVTREEPRKVEDKGIKEKRFFQKKQNQIKNPPPRTEFSCAHEFGYLGTLSKGEKIPDECLECMQIVKCLAAGRDRE